MSGPSGRPPLLEALPGTKYRAFEIRRFAKPMGFYWHQHPEIELVYVVRGNGVRYVGESILPFHTGDLCLIGSNIPHAYCSHPRSRDFVEMLVLWFLPERLGPDFWSLPDAKSFKELIELSQRGLSFNVRHLSPCARYLSEMERCSDLDRLAVFFRIFATLGKAREPRALNTWKSARAGRSTVNPRLQKILSWMESPKTDHITQSRAAKLVGMSPAAFSRFFRTHTGRPFIRHYNELRIARACVSLATSSRTVADIAMESRFDNISNFNRRFKQIVDMTPRQYRENLPVETTGSRKK